MKKLVLGLGTLATIAIPTATVVSCGISKSQIRKGLKPALDSIPLELRKDYIYIETKTETAAFSWNGKDHVTYQVWKNIKTGKLAYKEV